MRKIKNWIEKNEVLILILLLVVLLRIPSLFEPNHYADEDIYLVLGQALKKGLVFYRDIHDNKPPLLYLTASLAGSVVWFRFILLVWNLFNVVWIWKLAEKLIKNKTGIWLTTLLFAVLSSVPLTEGNISNGEIFMIMPTTVAVYWLWVKEQQLKKNNLQSYFWIGILFSLAFLFKVPVLFELIAIMFWLVLYQAKHLSSFLQNIFAKKTWLIIIGFLLPIVLSVIYYTLVGAGESYIRSALGQNIGYLSSWEGNNQPFYQSGLFIRGVIFILLVALVYLSKKKLTISFALISLWFVGALFGALLSGRPYPHYFIEILPAGTLLLGMLIFANKNKTSKIIGFILLFLTFWSVNFYKFWYYPSLPYYRNFISYISHRKTENEFRQFWGDKVIANYQTADYILKITDPDEKIFVWGTEPAIYALSNRLPVGKYTVSYHILDFKASDEIAKILVQEKPRVIIKIRDEKHQFNQLNGLLANNYALVKVIGQANIYLKYVNK